MVDLWVCMIVKFSSHIHVYMCTVYMILQCICTNMYTVMCVYMYHMVTDTSTAEDICDRCDGGWPEQAEF